ncbi:type I-B CRISPR-associated protein Cas5 [Clostridium sp. cel8]|jgi:CRISPR-associated protein Cas5h|uniref:type I-B CRISPR-associated protein Cas5b n=1 Tax=unclassified Clostridium TaxID=2614128 RepID=UPI0015F40104|nr:type I-B CRISPR-associated protein Cas5b [Clostridium sp. cel8]MBA5851224.1 type I-B CRISPR-associated protein Cas5 [Clostridium sp. cel8]
MDILIFDLKGKFAHFRKFYTNSSSLTYSVPPRTTIEGIIGAILGMERDSYYEVMSKDAVKIALRKMSKTYKIMQTVNYIKVTSEKYLIDPKEHTQIPFEIVTSDEMIIYRVYVSSDNKEIMNKLEYSIKNKSFEYTPYLGAAPFNCSINFVGKASGEYTEKENFQEISSLINSDYICNGGIDLNKKNLFLVKEKMPSDFLKDRIIYEVNSYIFDENCQSINVKLNCKSVNIKYNEVNENIVFM